MIHNTQTLFKNPLFALFILILLLPCAYAASNHITLLTVAETTNKTISEVGGTADLYLTIRQGKGAIFIDSFPLTRIDTQSSIRYANQIACDFLQEDCTRYDFFYTIRADSSMMGGPSAGGAIAVLTVAVLDGQRIRQDTAMTGTINSGGILGPVAGITSKIDGAKNAGIKKVLIPALTTKKEIGFENKTIHNAQGVTNKTNETKTNETNNRMNKSVVQEPLRNGIVQELSSGIDVIGVGTLEEALFEFTGKEYVHTLADIIVPKEYTTKMAVINEMICNRTTLLQTTIASRNISYNDTLNYTQRIERLQNRAYSKASLCFSQNVELNALLLNNSARRYSLQQELQTKVKLFEATVLNKSIITISDLETYAIVKERIEESRVFLEGLNKSDPNPRELAYAEERLVSAQIWSTFFGMSGNTVLIDKAHLQKACLSKLAEAEERINYVRWYAPDLITMTAFEEAQSQSIKDPILCILSASQAKAQANLVANALSVEEQSVDALIEQKLLAAQIVVRKQQAKGFFPILGYSYTQYAEDLRVDAQYSALIFAEYALEISNLDIYFPKEKKFRFPIGFGDSMLLFGLGAFFGIGMTVYVVSRRIDRYKQHIKEKYKKK